MLLTVLPINSPPTTGTLNDLTIISSDGFTFHPSNFGGITTFELNGQLLRPWEGRHSVQLVEESYAGEIYSARFRWSYQGDTFEFVIQLQLNGSQLVVDFLSSETNSTEFAVDRSEETPQPRLITLPYGHTVLYTNGLFLSAVADRMISNASTSYPQAAYYSDQSAYYGYGGEYRIDTHGQRHPLRERIYLVASPVIQDTFYKPPNPYSPYRQLLEDKVIVDLWANFREYDTALQQLHAAGMTDLFVIFHVWQKYGYDNGLPTSYPPGEEFGGEAAFKEVLHLCRQSGYLCAVHTNYVDFYPNAEEWAPNDVALNPDGRWINSWFNESTGIQSYLLKPSRALHYAQQYEPVIHAQLNTNASFLDVHSAIHPSDKVDYDGRVTNSALQSATYDAYRQLIAYTRSVHGGPVAGESFGNSAHLWAGYMDALEADPRNRAEEGGTDVPTIVDYKLTVLHDLFVPHGVGYLERFYLRQQSGFTSRQLERYRATEIAFGNAGFLSNPLRYNRITLTEARQEYCFMKHIQQQYLSEQPEAIDYFYNDHFLTLTQALNVILPTTEMDAVQATLNEALGVVRVRYTNNLELLVNRTQARTVQYVAGDLRLTLPPNGFIVRRGADFVAYHARQNGNWVNRIEPVDSSCALLINGSVPIYLPVILRDGHVRGTLP